MKKLSKVLIITESYPPILNSAGRLFFELAETFTSVGFDVLVVTEKPKRYLSHELGVNVVKEHRLDDTVRVVRVPAFAKLRSVLMLRYLEQFMKMFIYFFVALRFGYQRDVIIYSPPLPLAVSGILVSKCYRKRCIVNVQDLYPETAIVLGVLKNRFLKSIARAIEAWIYRNSTKITVHSKGNRDYVVSRGTDPNKVEVINNWIDLKRYNTAPLYNGFREKYKLSKQFVVSYAGVLGIAQDITTIIQAARDFRDDKQVCFVIAGAGCGYDTLIRRAEMEGLGNILFLTPQTEQEYIKLLQSSNVCLVALSKTLLTPAVPGKLQCIMAVGRPVICVVPSISGAKAIIEESHCGIWADPEDKGSLSNAIHDLIMRSGSNEEMGKRGRIYAERHFDRHSCTQRYIDLLASPSR